MQPTEDHYRPAEPPRLAPATPQGRPVPSAWVQRWSHLVPATARVLDVACGSGRHVRWFAERGCSVTGIDRDAAALQALTDVADIIVADIESGPWPCPAKEFDAVIVTNYLWRERLAAIVGSVAEGGVLIYETFASGQETVGKPSNPAFLLRPGELLQAVQELRVLAFEDGFEGRAKSPAEEETRDSDTGSSESEAQSQSGRFVQRIVAVREAPRGALPTRWVLPP